MSKNRAKMGHLDAAIPCTRLLVKKMDHNFTGKTGLALLAINDNTGKYTSVNVYGTEADGWNAGKNYSPEHMTHDLPKAGDDKWKTWAKDYVAKKADETLFTASDFEQVVLVELAKSETTESQPETPTDTETPETPETPTDPA